MTQNNDKVKLVIIGTLLILAFIFLIFTMSLYNEPEPEKIILYLNIEFVGEPPMVINEWGIWNRTDCVDTDYWYNNGKGLNLDNADNNKLKETYNCFDKELHK